MTRTDLIFTLIALAIFLLFLLGWGVYGFVVR